MKLLHKTLFILILVFALRIIQSCGCPDDPHFFDFENISILNLDNSKDYVRSGSTDAMFSSAVAFEITISGRGEFASLKRAILSLGFSEITASDKCPLQFKSNQKISKITIITMEAISPEIQANTDVTDIFLGIVPFHSSPTFLYEPLDNIYHAINPEIFIDNTTSCFQVVCNRNILNDKAQFTINIDLSDGRTLTGTTNLITLTPSF